MKLASQGPDKSLSFFLEREKKYILIFSVLILSSPDKKSPDRNFRD